MLATPLLLAAALAALPAPPAPDAAVAEGLGVRVTAAEYVARLKEQSPIIRSRFTTLERKKEFLDGLIRFKVLAGEAWRQGLDRDPDVVQALEKLMVQKLVQRYFQDVSGARDLPEAELREYYERNRAEYVRAARVRVAAVTFLAPPGTPLRAEKAAAARKAADAIRERSRNEPLAFSQAAKELSEDDATRAVGGDLGFKTREELEKDFGERFAAAVFALKDAAVSGVLESKQGFHVVRVAGRQDALNRTFEQVREQIAAKLQREGKQGDLEAMVAGLRAAAGVRIDDAVLERIVVE